jgi:hypothetical protein
MKNEVHFDTFIASPPEPTHAHLASSLVFELQQMAALLQDALTEEERKASVRDPAHPQYPMLARSLRSRFDNLQKTIFSLQARAQSAA